MGVSRIFFLLPVEATVSYESCSRMIKPIVKYGSAFVRFPLFSRLGLNRAARDTPIRKPEAALKGRSYGTPRYGQIDAPEDLSLRLHAKTLTAQAAIRAKSSRESY